MKGLRARHYLWYTKFQYITPHIPSLLHRISLNNFENTKWWFLITHSNLTLAQFWEAASEGQTHGFIRITKTTNWAYSDFESGNSVWAYKHVI